MSRHALAPLSASDALRHDKLQLTAAHSRHNKTLATLTRAAGASRAAWTSSGLSQSLYVFYGECESNAQQYGTLAMSSQTCRAGHPLFHSRGVGFRGWSNCHDQIRTPKQRVVKPRRYHSQSLRPLLQFTFGSTNLIQMHSHPARGREGVLIWELR